MTRDGAKVGGGKKGNNSFTSSFDILYDSTFYVIFASSSSLAFVLRKRFFRASMSFGFHLLPKSSIETIMRKQRSYLINWKGGGKDAIKHNSAFLAEGRSVVKAHIVFTILPASFFTAQNAFIFLPSREKKCRQKWKLNINNLFMNTPSLWWSSKSAWLSSFLSFFFESLLHEASFFYAFSSHANGGAFALKHFGAMSEQNCAGVFITSRWLHYIDACNRLRK